MALEDVIALEEHARAAGAGELGEDALLEEVRRRYRERGGGSLVDLLLDGELAEARRRPTEYERILAMLGGGGALERELQRMRRYTEEIREAEEAGRVRWAKSRGGKHRDPLRAAAIAVVVSCLSGSDYLDTCNAVWAWIRRRPQRLSNGVVIDAVDGGLRISDSAGRSKVITENSFRRYFTEARKFRKEAAQ